MAVRIKLNSRGMRDLLNSGSVGAYLEGKIQRGLAAAKANAPVKTGEYRNALHVELAHTDRVVARIVGGTDHDMIVEADTGNLARALDAAK